MPSAGSGNVPVVESRQRSGISAFGVCLYYVSPSWPIEIASKLETRAQGTAEHTHYRSVRALKPSPSKMNPAVIRMSAAPGKNDIHH
jgi:hypothetical protein